MPRRKSKADALEVSEAKIKLLCDNANNHMKAQNYTKALAGYNEALEISSSDVNALIARSKCYLLLGEAAKALDDAEAALKSDKNNIRAIYQKAESLYYLGQFEQSLMFFHRGLRLRPELALFRLGVQKTQEAIENTIGVAPKHGSNSSKTNSAASARPKKRSSNHERSKSVAKMSYKKSSQNDIEKRISRKLLGELCVDKEYLENLLKHPDLKRADTNTENISVLAKDAVEFLNKRQEFWRQQRPCTALPSQKDIEENDIPGWF